MKITISFSYGFILLWQIVAMGFITYAVMMQDFVAMSFGSTMLIFRFNRDHEKSV